MSGVDLKSLLKQLNDYIESELEKPNFNCFVIKQYGGPQRSFTRASRNLVINGSGDNFLHKLNDLSLKNDSSSYYGDISPYDGGLVPSCSTTGFENTDGVTLPGVHTRKSKAVDIIDPTNGRKIN